MVAKIRSGAHFAFDILLASAHEYGVDRVSRMSAAVAYRGMFAIAPMLIIAVGVLGAVVGGSEEAQQEIFESIERFAGAEVADALTTFVSSAVTVGNTAAIVGIILLLWTASSLFYEIQNDLNDIFHVPYEYTSGVMGFVKKRGVGFLWAVGLGMTLIAVWFLNLLWRFFGGVFPDDLAWVHRLIALLTPLVSVIVLPVLFALIFQSMTAIKVRWRAVWLGAVFTAVVFLTAAYGTGLYFAWEDGASALSLAGAFFVLLLLAYVLASVFLFGAVVTKVYDDFLDAGDIMSPSLRDKEPGPTPNVLIAEPPEAVPVATVLAFLGGLFVGWRRNRR
ncbi:MAG: YihY/virulence factor BrkB family protein [Acidimicrobiia bacterium]